MRLRLLRATGLIATGLIGRESGAQDVCPNSNVREIADMRASFSEPLKTAGAAGPREFLRQRSIGMLDA